jgi:hypothetical protein
MLNARTIQSEKKEEPMGNDPPDDDDDDDGMTVDDEVDKWEINDATLASQQCLALADARKRIWLNGNTDYTKIQHREWMLSIGCLSC